MFTFRGNFPSACGLNQRGGAELTIFREGNPAGARFQGEIKSSHFPLPRRQTRVVFMAGIPPLLKAGIAIHYQKAARAAQKKKWRKAPFFCGK